MGKACWQQITSAETDSAPLTTEERGATSSLSALLELSVQECVGCSHEILDEANVFP